MVLAGCRPATSETSGDTSTPQPAQLILAVTDAPSDVSCIEVTVTAATTSSRLFDVTPGGSSNITVGGLPGGAVTVNELAFARLADQLPRPDDMKVDAYRRNIAARAFDVARYLLFWGVPTNVGQVTSIRTLEKQIRRLKASEYA